jgi:hypothetical protein
MDDQAELQHLQHLAAAAGPSIPDDAHVDAAHLGRMRAGDEDPALDAAYGHVARCVACRSALASPETAAARERDAAREHAAALAATQRAKRRVLPTWGWLAAAAAIAVVLGAAVLRRSPAEPIAITQRPIAGWMGGSAAPTPSVAPADANLELRIGAAPFPAAVLVTCDARGRVVAPPAAFTRDAKGDLVAVVAPRTFAAHEGRAVGLVVLGSDEAVRAAAATEAATAGSTSVDALTEALRSGRARVERVTLGD